MKTIRAFWSILTMIIVASLMFAACAPAATEEPAAPAPTQPPAPTAAPAATEPPAATEAPAAVEVDFPVMPGGALEEALKGTYKGTTVTVDGAMEGNDPDGVKFDKGVKAFEDAT